MRIAYISADHGVPIFGRKGCSIHAQEVLRSMLRRGARVEVFSTSIEGTRPAGLEQLCVHPLPRPDGPAQAGIESPVASARPANREGGASSPAPSEPVAERAGGQKPFPVSEASAEQSALRRIKTEPAARERAALANNEVLRHALERAGEFNFVYERYSLWSYAAMEFARDSGLAGLLEVNAPLIEEQAQYRVLVDRSGAEQVAQRLFGAARALLAVSSEVAAWLDSFPPARGKIHVVPNGIRPERFPAHLSASLPAPAGVFTVGFVGTLKAWHGLSVLVEAFARLQAHRPNSRLLIVGDGPERGNLAAELAARGLTDSAVLTGAVEAGAVPGLLASMDVAVAPYPALANFYFSPLKVYEYMAAGVPVVASRIGQLKTLIQPEVNGILVEPGDPGELAQALERLAVAPALRRQLSQAARCMVLASYTWDAVLERIFNLAGVSSSSPTMPFLV